VSTFVDGGGAAGPRQVHVPGRVHLADGAHARPVELHDDRLVRVVALGKRERDQRA
jgi:hypothetical protein